MPNHQPSSADNYAIINLAIFIAVAFTVTIDPVVIGVALTLVVNSLLHNAVPLPILFLVCAGITDFVYTFKAFEQAAYIGCTKDDTGEIHLDPYAYVYAYVLELASVIVAATGLLAISKFFPYLITGKV